MVSFSVKINMADEELYENFIEPRKNNGELPNLMVRLLTAYATDANISYQIDQFLDKDEAPDMCDARDAIFKALERFNELDSSIAQGMEALNDISDADEVQSDDDDYDIVTDDVTENTGMDAENTDMGTVNQPVSALLSANEPDMTSARAEVGTSTQGTVPNVGARQVSGAGNSVGAEGRPSAEFGSNTADNSTVLTALNTLTAQMSQLTMSVSSMVNMWQTTPMQMVQPMGYGMMPGMQMAMPNGAMNGQFNPMQGQVGVIPNQAGMMTGQSGMTQGQVGVAQVQPNTVAGQADVSQVNEEPQTPAPIAVQPVDNTQNIAQSIEQGITQTQTQAPNNVNVVTSSDNTEVAVKTPITLAKPVEAIPENPIVAEKNAVEPTEQVNEEEEQSDASALDFLSDFESSLFGV